jgi:hypothetical protein
MARKSKSALGLKARGAKGAPRERLARAAGFRSDTELAEHFPENRQKQVRQMQQALADLLSALNLTDSTASAAASHYGTLIRFLANPQEPPEPASVEPDDTPPTSGRAGKQASLATDALRQMVLEAVESPLALLPSLLADDTLSDQQKLNRLAVYTSALEALYEPLELDPIGEPGEAASFDPQLHESAAALTRGDACIIRQIGFRRSHAVVRKAVVVVGE